MNATAKFYTCVFVALAIVVAVSFALGYRAGFEHARSVIVRAPAAPTVRRDR